jgi:hypothetical protein
VAEVMNKRVADVAQAKGALEALVNFLNVYGVRWPDATVAETIGPGEETIPPDDSDHYLDAGWWHNGREFWAGFRPGGPAMFVVFHGDWRNMRTLSEGGADQMGDALRRFLDD